MKTTTRLIRSRYIHAALLLAISTALAQNAPIPRPQPPKPGSHKPGSQPKGSATDFDLPAEFRTVDGSANNTANPTWGTPSQAFIRLAPSEYADGVSSPAGATRPSARAISNAVIAQPFLRPNARGASDMIWQWGQFIDHDLDETMSATPAEAFPILVPKGDTSFDPTSTGTVTIPLSRSIYTTVSGKREQTNALTAYIDASQVYGSDAARATGLRALDGTGKLKVSAGNLLPFNTGGLPNAPAGSVFYVAGDIRVNEQIGLLAIHTLFVREHNYWATEYQKANPGVDDEETYQFARMLVAAEIQAITYREFLPVLIGDALPHYRGYDARVNTGVSNEFATAAYRLGHTLLSPQIMLLNADGSDVSGTPLALRNAFFNLPVYATNGIDPIMRGLVTQRAQELDEWLVDDVRNFLFGAPGSGGFDLASLNIQRGRDHGLASFSNTRRALGLPPVTRFEDINRDRTVLAELRAGYKSPADVDLWVGGLAEADAPGSMAGPTFTRILADQFRRCRDGDRFWYQAYLPAGLVRVVEQQTLATIIRRNTGIKTEISDTAFLAPSPRRGR